MVRYNFQVSSDYRYISQILNLLCYQLSTWSDQSIISKYLIVISLRLEETTAALQVMAAALEEEKGKTDMLLHQMLPVKVAEQLRQGKKVEAGW